MCSPFRAFAYPLPPALFVSLTSKVVEQERKRRAVVRNRWLQPKRLQRITITPRRAGAAASWQGHAIPPRIRVAYMSSDFGGMVCVCVCGIC